MLYGVNRDLGIIYHSEILCEKYYQNKLSPRFWRNKKFNSGVREKLVDIAENFYKTLKLQVPIIDIQLTGSLANYNYTDLSDLDVHIIIDFSQINQDIELVKKALDGVRFIWNARHDIVINDHDVELYVQDVNEQHMASGLYSLLYNKWIKEPVYDPPEIDERDVEVKFQHYVKEIAKLQECLERDDVTREDLITINNRANKLKEKIQEGRKECLQQKQDEFCVENLVFKRLRNSGAIEQLINIASKAYDMSYSL